MVFFIYVQTYKDIREQGHKAHRYSLQNLAQFLEIYTLWICGVVELKR